MKTTTIMLTALLLSATATASAQSNVTLYGSVDAGISYVNNQRGGSSWRQDSGNRSPDRIGFRGVEDLGDGYKAQFVIENGFNLDDGSMKRAGVLFNRYSVVGLTTPAGTVTLGHMPDFMYEYLRFQSNGNMGSAYFFHPGNLDNMANQFQLDNAIKYESPNFGGFTLGAMNGFGEQAGSFNKSRTYSFGVKYLGNALNAGLAYTVSHDRAINIGGTLGLASLLGQTLSANPVAPDAQYTNITVTSVARYFFGAYSVLSAMAFGTAQPSPMPARNRSAIKPFSPVANAVTSVNRPKQTAPANTVRLRPQRSPRVPPWVAPIIMPTRPALNAAPNEARLTCQVLISVGAT